MQQKRALICQTNTIQLMRNQRYMTQCTTWNIHMHDATPLLLLFAASSQPVLPRHLVGSIVMRYTHLIITTESRACS